MQYNKGLFRDSNGPVTLWKIPKSILWDLNKSKPTPKEDAIDFRAKTWDTAVSFMQVLV